jgi:hypothetical protein
MTKPWQESWSADGDSLELDGGHQIALFTGEGDSERATLAAAAPELYRVLEMAVQTDEKAPMWIVDGGDVRTLVDGQDPNEIGSTLLYRSKPPERVVPGWLKDAKAALRKARGEI